MAFTKNPKPKLVQRPRDYRDPNDEKSPIAKHCIRCKATCRNPISKYYQQRCPHPAMLSGFCHMHGGRRHLQSMADIWFPRKSLKTGEPMKRTYLPDEWLDDFAAFMEDKNLKSLDPDLALIEILIKSKTEGIKTSGNITILSRLQALYTQACSDTEAGKAAFQEMGRAIDGARKGPPIEKEMIALIEQRRKIIETDAKKSAQDATTLRSEQATIMCMALVAAINEFVTDQRMIAGIKLRFAQILGGNTLHVPGLDPRQFITKEEDTVIWD